MPETGNHQDHALAVLNRNANKVVKDAISYARIQANNEYFKVVLGQKMSKELGSSSIYLTEEQYRQVNNLMTCNIYSTLEIENHLNHELHLFSGADSVVSKP